MPPPSAVISQEEGAFAEDAPVETLTDAPAAYDGGNGDACDLDGIDPYDPEKVIAYEIVNLTDEQIAELESIGYSWWDTYSQIPEATVNVDINITVSECETVSFTDVNLEIGREMGYVAPSASGETSWRVDYNDSNSAQKIGGYDNARWWAEIYSGPVAEPFLYQYAIKYLPETRGRRSAWMTLSTNYWPANFAAAYNAFEPYSEDMMDRDYGKNGWISMYEGDPAYMTCQVGTCDDTRLNACLTKVYDIEALDASDSLVAETGDCFDWSNIAATYAWEVYFSHWDGFMSPHNGYVEELGDSASPDTSRFSLRIAGVDLVNPNWVSVEEVTFYSWSTLYPPCWKDQSEGGCRAMLVADLQILIEAGRSGKMASDLDKVAASRQALGLWWEGVDEGWYNDERDWLTARPDYVEMALTDALDPCNDWTAAGYNPWDTGLAGECGDTGFIDTGKP